MESLEKRVRFLESIVSKEPPFSFEALSDQQLQAIITPCRQACEAVGGFGMSWPVPTGALKEQAQGWLKASLDIYHKIGVAMSNGVENGFVTFCKSSDEVKWLFDLAFRHSTKKPGKEGAV